MRKWVYALIVAVGVLGLVVGIILVSGVVRLGGTPQCSEGGSRPGEGPLGGGTRTTLAGAQFAARFAVLIPDVRAARLSTLTQVWVNKHHNVALVFAHGKVMITFGPAIYSNARKEFERFITQNHVTAAIGRVHQHPALVITPGTDSCGSNPAWVEFERAGIDINVYSSSYGTGTLLTVRDSLKPWQHAMRAAGR